MAKPKQDDMFPQKRIPAIERWADKIEEKRSLINGLSTEMENFEFKLAETVHANEAACEVQNDPIQGKVIVYKRGDYSISVKRGKEKVNVKIKDASKPPTDNDSGAPADDHNGDGE